MMKRGGEGICGTVSPKERAKSLEQSGREWKLQQQTPLKHKSFIAGANRVALIVSSLVSVSCK